MHLRQNLGRNRCEACFQLGKYSPDFPVLWNKLCPNTASLCFLALRNIHDSLDFKSSFCNVLFMHQWPWKIYSWVLATPKVLFAVFPSGKVCSIGNKPCALHTGNAEGSAAPSAARSHLHTTLLLLMPFSLVLEIWARHSYGVRDRIDRKSVV